MMTWNEVIMYIINTVFKLIIMVLIPYGVNLIRTKLKSDMQNNACGKDHIKIPFS